MKIYVLGFAFDEARQSVVLIKKNRPDWQKGKFNGVGGKMEPFETTPFEAMAREFNEETGVQTQSSDWKVFALMNFPNDVMGGAAKVWCFRMFSDSCLQCTTREEEEIAIIPMSEVYELPLMHNLHILLRLALQDEFTMSYLNQI